MLPRNGREAAQGWSAAQSRYLANTDRGFGIDHLPRIDGSAGREWSSQPRLPSGDLYIETQLGAFGHRDVELAVEDITAAAPQALGAFEEWTRLLAQRPTTRS